MSIDDELAAFADEQDRGEPWIYPRNSDEPMRTDITYKTAKGTSLQGHVYTAQDSRGRYSITVVDYNGAPNELATAIDEAAAAMRAKGKPTYDAVNMLDMHRSWRMTVETPAQRRTTGGSGRPSRSDATPRTWS